jgi:hypothetical protein
VTVTDGSLALPDALFLLSVLLLTEHHQDAFLHRTHPWMYVDAPTQRRFELPHPPRIETSQALLGSVPVPTRIRLLIEACELAVPVWTAWAKGADLTYFDGVMAMSSVPHKLAESTIAAVRTWLEDGDPKPAHSAGRGVPQPPLAHARGQLDRPGERLLRPLRSLQPGGLRARGREPHRRAHVHPAGHGGARHQRARPFLGEPFRKAFFLAWWRACLRCSARAEALLTPAEAQPGSAPPSTPPSSTAPSWPPSVGPGSTGSQ